MARRLGGGDERVCIAVLDGPIDRAHPCFSGANITQLDTLAAAVTDERALAHGTHVASIIFGQPGSGVAGLAPRCRGLLAPIFGGGGERLSCSQLDLARAILLAVENGAHIINISGGQLTPSSEPEPVLAQAIAACARRNVLIVAAAGNDGCDCLHVPACAPTVLAVGAMDDAGAPLGLSNWGAAYRSRGLLAPGLDVPGAAPGGGVGRRTGTSFAAPIVSGLAGLFASWRIRQGEPLDLHRIRDALIASASPCDTGDGNIQDRCLRGRLNIQGAIDMFEREEAIVSEAQSLAAIDPIATAFAEPPTTEARAVHADALTTSDAAPATPFALGSSVSGPTLAQIHPFAGVTTSDCGCGGGVGAKCGCNQSEPAKPAHAYALGLIGYDFGSEARRDSFAQAMAPDVNQPLIPAQLLAYLAANPQEAASLVWTLNLDATPVYAIHPMGPFAADVYARLREFLEGQLHQGVELVSVPGVVSGSMRLMSGQVVPVLIPVLRGMYSWATTPLVNAVLGERPTRGAEGQENYDQQASGLTDFLNRVYYDLRNLGITAEDRALNYAATNAFQIAEVVRSATRDELDLDHVAVHRSPVCRPDSECYDVEVSFFNPSNTQAANRVFRFTVDVSDVVPVSIGAVRNWTRRA
ncbi:PatA/PatG family cyanobactin maturation protease [Phenylobacterium sp.]|uniref:PatA/PatG family cyanobactin maturation protease n=1 Tax=Phenylobacterium sp. TaxID=1871053 RepID=UPI0025EE3E8C|nr:PatA/PatG family cyanobactin maturation protease [Phenylobacterium sp.]